jgi:uncharacterized membrane protein YqiK
MVFTLVTLGLSLVLALVVLSGIVYIPHNRIGIVERRFSRRGSVKGGLIALASEAGFQPDVLRGGLHFLMPLQYRVHRVDLVTIPQGKIGYVFARDGLPLAPTQALADNSLADDFQDARAFLKRGGQKGPQRRVLREGTYAINIAQFVVLTDGREHFLRIGGDDAELFRTMSALIAERDGFEPVVIRDDCLGVVTVHDGPSLENGEIIAPIVGDDAADASRYHNKFQDAAQFLLAGGMRGRQLQILVEGTYFINRLFATVECLPKTVVDVGTVGVVVSYTGKSGRDLSGAEYKHGELVERGRRGVWEEPLLPGKYAFNPYAGKVIMVPTTNIILKWNKVETGAHRLDENLAEVSLITKDAFEPLLPLSVVVHIDYRKAALVIQRFGDVKRLVEQTLDPMVSAYFKNVGQTRTLIQLVQDRSAIQDQAGKEMRAKFSMYNLELQEVLIGTPSSSKGDHNIEEILKQLRARQIAEEQVETYARQERASHKERELREAEARARSQQQLTESELSIIVQSNQGKADYQRAVQQASQIRALAEARGQEVKLLAEAEADRVARVGIAEALAVEEKVQAYGGPKFQLTQQVMMRFAEAIQQGGVDVVPRVVVGQSGDKAGSNVLESLLSLLLSERLADGEHAAKERSPQAESIRRQLQAALIQ